MLIFSNQLGYLKSLYCIFSKCLAMNEYYCKIYGIYGIHVHINNTRIVHMDCG